MEYATAHKVIHNSLYFNILEFKPVNEHVTTVFVTAIAGHEPQFALDFQEDKSLMQCGVEHCLGGVVSIHIKAPTFISRWVVTYKTWIEQIAETIRFVGGPVRLVGVCQGGALAAKFATEYPDLVSELVVAAAPINTSTPSIISPAQKFPYSAYHAVVVANGWIMPGKLMVDTWYAQNKDEHDAAKLLPENAHFYACYADAQSIDPWAYLETIQGWFLSLSMYDSLDIQCPTHTIVGLTDEITPQEQVEAIENRCRLPIEKHYTAGGHMSTFASRTAMAADGPYAKIFSRT
jgi:pimeloyl-ACP methyl ester carboxylesterase